MATSIKQKKLMAERGYITAADAAAVVSQNYSTIYRYMKEQGVKALRVGNRWYVEVRALSALYRQQDKNSPYPGMLLARVRELVDQEVAA